MMKHLNQTNFAENIAEGFCVVTIGATWCSGCQILRPILKEIAPKFSEKIKFFGINFDDAGDLLTTLNVRQIPTMIFYKNGTEIGNRLTQPKSQTNIENILNELLK